MNTIMVSGSGWKLGDMIRVQFGAYGVYLLRVVGVFANVGPLSGYLVSNATLAADSGVRTDSVDLVRAPGSARGSIQAALAGYPGARLLDQSGYIANQTATLNSLLTLVTAMLILAIVIALLASSTRSRCPSRNAPGRSACCARSACRATSSGSLSRPSR